MYLAYATLKYCKLRIQKGNYLKKSHFKGFEHNTLFILGSGASVCELNKTNFSHIRNNVSIGINTWPLHPFVPDFYAFEYFRNPGKKVDLLSEALQRDEVLSKKPYFLIKDSVLSASSYQCIRIPAKLKDRMLYYTSLPILTRDVSLLSQAYHDLIQLQAAEWIPLCCTADRGASIVRIASLSVLLGFKNIVFVGVDLNNTQYFWQKDEGIIKRWNTAELSSGQTGKVHKTDDPSETRFTVTEVLQAMQEVARVNYGVSMWTTSSKSALSSFLNLYDFPSGVPNK